MLRVITWVGSCVRGSLHGWGHAWGHPSDNGVTHSGKGSICSKLFVRQSFCGWPGRVKYSFSTACSKESVSLQMQVFGRTPHAILTRRNPKGNGKKGTAKNLS